MGLLGTVSASSPLISGVDQSFLNCPTAVHWGGLALSQLSYFYSFGDFVASQVYKCTILGWPITVISVPLPPLKWLCVI